MADGGFRPSLTTMAPVDSANADISQDQKLRELAQGFGRAAATQDAQALRKITTDDVTLTVPGTSRLAGRHQGVDDVLQVPGALQRAGLKLEVLWVATGASSVVICGRDHGERHGVTLDVTVAMVLTLTGDRISGVVMHLSDVKAFSTYVDAALPPRDLPPSPKPGREGLFAVPTNRNG